ncbi:hypothetical protein ACJMK2_031205 [Sinanodonta woodiana]|uniref:Mitochondria-eating protein n=1 Tax=Sinanodonta woodiana TaxID=1069815 RepID=A0ABD3WYK2_SINWO
MSQTPTPRFIERMENGDLKDFKKEDVDMITREINMLYSKLRELVIYDATSIQIFLTYLREGNLHHAELFRKRALFELLTIEEDRDYVMLMEEHELEGCECVVQYSEHYYDPEEKEQGPTLLEEKRKPNTEKINVEERMSKPTKRLKDSTEVSTDYFDPEFERRRKMNRKKIMKPIIRSIPPDVSINYQCSVIKEQRLSPEGGDSVKMDIKGDTSSESRNQKIEVNETSDHKNSTFLSSTTDPKRDIRGEVNNLKPSSAGEGKGFEKPLKEIADHLESTRRRGMVDERSSRDKASTNLNSVSNVINETNTNLAKDTTKDEDVLLHEGHSNKTNTRNPLKQNNDVLSEQNANTLQTSQLTPDQDEYIHTKDEENDDKMKQPSDFIDLTNLMGPVISSRTSHSQNDGSTSPEQNESYDVSAMSTISNIQEVDSSGRYFLKALNMDNQKTTTYFRTERADDIMSDDKNDNMVIQQREMNTESPKTSRRPHKTKQDNGDIMTEKDTYETNTLKSAGEREDTTKEITQTRNIEHSSTNLQGNIDFEHLTKPSIQPVGNTQSGDNTFGLDRSAMNSEQSLDVNIDNTHIMNTERDTREVTVTGRTSNPDGVNISVDGLNAAEQEKRTDSSMSIWQENKPNADDPQAKYISFKTRSPKDARESDDNYNNIVNDMNNVESMITSSKQKGAAGSKAKEIDAAESSSEAIVASKDKNYNENVMKVANDQKSERLLYGTNRIDQTHISGIRSDVEKEKFPVNPKTNGHKTLITRRVSVGTLGTLSPIREGEQTKDETDVNVSTESSSQPYTEKKTKTKGKMQNGDDETEEIKVIVNIDNVNRTLDGSKSPSVRNIVKSEYQDSNNKPNDIDDIDRIDDALTASHSWTQNIDSDNLIYASEGENDKVSSDSDGTKPVIDAERCIQHEGTLSDGSASNGLKAIGTGINTNAHELLTDNSMELKESSLSLQLSDERGDSNLLEQEKRTILMKDDTRPDVDKHHEMQAEHKNSSHLATASKDTNELQSNIMDNASETSVALIAQNYVNSVQDDNSKHSKVHVSEEGKVMETKQSKADVSSTTQLAFSERVSRERTFLSQNGGLAQIVKDNTHTENSKRQEVDPGLEQTSRTHKGDSDPFQEGKDPSSSKATENKSDTARTTDDKINAKNVLKRVNEKMIKLDKQQEVELVSLKKKQVSNNVRDATINNSIKKSSTSRTQRNGNRTLAPIQINSNVPAGDERKSQNVHESQELLRRSEEASLLLRQGNPNITDLSDNNRPIKLAERFSELYDNEYTDAFEEIQKMNLGERKITNILLCVVKDAYYLCSERASDERNRLMSLMKNAPAATSKGNRLKADSLLKGIVAQSLKDNAQNLSASIWKEFFDSRYQNLFPEGIDSQNHRLLKYAQRCVEIVWWMCVQDPPIHLSWIEETESREFDKEEYRSYTKSGETVDFCVWPLIHQYKEGPILLKGIAQGK